MEKALVTQSSDTPRNSLRVAIVLVLLVGVIATVVAYLGTRESARSPVSPPSAAIDSALPIESIVLPHYEPELPSGPHQRTFAASCTICHSTLLVMTQPPLSQQKWTEVVQKMIKIYGAPVAPEAEQQIVGYLTAVKGK